MVQVTTIILLILCVEPFLTCVEEAIENPIEAFEHTYLVSIGRGHVAYTVIGNYYFNHSNLDGI